MLLACLLIALLAVACLAQAGLDTTYVIHRRTLATVAAGAVLLILNQDWWLLAFWAVLCWNALSRPYPAMNLSRLDTVLVFYAVYAVGRAFVTTETIVAVLVALACLPMVGYLVAQRWFNTDTLKLSLAQGNQNHSDAVLVVAMASAYGLAWAVSPWCLLLYIPNAALLRWSVKARQYKIGQAFVWLGLVALVPLALYSLWLAVAVAIAGAVPLSRKAYALRLLPEGVGVDNGRVRMWWILLLGGWWSYGWQTRLLGQGWTSWAMWADNFALLEWKKAGKSMLDYKHGGTMWLHPHSEYVHILFEHGLIGLACFLGWAGMLLAGAWQAGPMGQAVVFPAVAMGAVALTHFPWTFPGGAGENLWGHHGLVVMSAILVVLLGGA